MASLSLHNLRMDFIERNLFTGVSFDVEKGDKLGFIGANGVGKTTLFRIINGEVSPTEGNVFMSKDTVLGYMEQHACNHPDRNVFDELLSVFSYLEDYERELKTLEIKIEQINNNNISNADELNSLVERQTALEMLLLLICSILISRVLSSSS